MKFSFTHEQDEFRSSLRRFFADHSPSKEVRRLMDTEAGWERAGWQALNRDLGLAAVRIIGCPAAGPPIFIGVLP